MLVTSKCPPFFFFCAHYYNCLCYKSKTFTFSPPGYHKQARRNKTLYMNFYNIHSGAKWSTSQLNCAKPLRVFDVPRTERRERRSSSCQPHLSSHGKIKFSMSPPRCPDIAFCQILRWLVPSLIRILLRIFFCSGTCDARHLLVDLEYVKQNTPWTRGKRSL